MVTGINAVEQGDQLNTLMMIELLSISIETKILLTFVIIVTTFYSKNGFY